MSKKPKSGKVVKRIETPHAKAIMYIWRAKYPPDLAVRGREDWDSRRQLENRSALVKTWLAGYRAGVRRKAK